jgi:hypothetical protein
VADPPAFRTQEEHAPGAGSVFSLDHFLEDLLVHGEVGNGAFEPGILGFEFLQSLALFLKEPKHKTRRL